MVSSLQSKHQYQKKKKFWNTLVDTRLKSLLILLKEIFDKHRIPKKDSPSTEGVLGCYRCLSPRIKRLNHLRKNTSLRSFGKLYYACLFLSRITTQEVYLLYSLLLPDTRRMDKLQLIKINCYHHEEVKPTNNNHY